MSKNVLIFALLLLGVVVLRTIAPRYRKVLSFHALFYLVEAFAVWLLLLCSVAGTIVMVFSLWVGLFMLVGGLIGGFALKADVDRRRDILRNYVPGQQIDRDASGDAPDFPSHRGLDPAPGPSKCSACGGSGRRPCPSSTCRGGYEYTGGETSLSRYCSTCLGRGDISCSSCGGSGHG